MTRIIAIGIALGIAGGLYAARRPAVKPVGPVASQRAPAGLVGASAAFTSNNGQPSAAFQSGARRVRVEGRTYDVYPSGPGLWINSTDHPEGWVVLTSKSEDHPQPDGTIRTCYYLTVSISASGGSSHKLNVWQKAEMWTVAAWGKTQYDTPLSGNQTLAGGGHHDERLDARRNWQPTAEVLQ